MLKGEVENEKMLVMKVGFSNFWEYMQIDLWEWKVFAAYAVDCLGMPSEAVPLYDSSSRWSRKASRIHRFILEVGNFGHNRDMSYFERYPYVIRKAISLWRRVTDLCRHALIFPLDSLRFFPAIVFNGLRSAARGE